MKHFVVGVVMLATAACGCERVSQLLQSSSPEVTAPDPKPVSEQEATLFAGAMSLAINNGDAAAIERLIDYGTIVKRALAGARMPPEALDKTARDIAEGARASGLTAQLAGMAAQDMTVSLLSTRTQGAARRATFRALRAKGGFEHYDFLLTKRDDGDVVAADVLFMSSGEAMSTTLRRVLLAASDKSLLERLRSDETLFVQHLDEINRAAAARAQGKHAQELAALEALPDDLRNQKFILLQMQQALIENMDDPRYAKVIATLVDKYPNDPAAAVASMEHYFLRKDYAKALAAIDVVEKASVPDAYFGVLKVSALTEMGKLDAAKQVALATIAREPSLLPAHFGLISVLLKQKDNAAIADQLLRMHDRFNLAYDFETAPGYAEFVASSEYPGFKRKLAGTPDEAAKSP